MEGNVAVQGIDRSLISNQGIIKPIANGLRKRKKSNKEMKQVPKQQPKPQQKNVPTKEDSAFSKRSGIPLSEVMAQGGVTPKSVIKDIKQYGAYSTKIKPSGLYKKPAKKK